ncbi:MAG: UvrD-helicase domain-containing protein, partial [Desulfobacterales bacterium]|nr:UvrD-helicase domain-containing protein [Desulfobacterales bacterium]
MSHSTSAAYGPLPLDPFNLDLEQVTLIEASAGTGKTYTITTLFTRLVAMGYPVESILVVTFTEAAAAELKLRIRQRLNECETALSDENTQIDGKDELVSFLFAQPDRDMIRKRLRLAVTCFDLAAIMTIHSFCFSILKDNAFESGSYFDMELLTDSQGFLNQVATDFFSSRINDMNPLFLSFLEQAGFTPQSLVNSMARVVGRSKIKIVPTPLVFNDIGDEYSGQVKKTAQILAQEKEAIFTLIQTHKGVDKRSYSKKNLPSWLNGCVELLDGAQKTVSVFNMKEKGDPLYKFTRTRLADKTKAGHTPPDHPFFDACETLLEFTNVMEENLMALQYEFLEYYAQALAAMKQNQGACFFDDLINDLAAALEGPRRNALKKAVLDRYQGCLIDEFQDTDPGQYYIFSTLFSTLASHCPGDDGRAMPFFMIGDPKQAIYGFRGGDIFAYLAASRTCKQSFTLTTNYRSAPKVVQGINNIFLRIKNPFGFKEIPFFPVDTPDYAVDILVKESKPVPPVSFVMMNRNTMACDRSGMIKKAVAIDMLPKILATDILSILNDPHLCLKQKGSGEDESNRIFPGDMAVLVRTNDQAEAVRQALSQNNIPCFLSKTGSVFDSPQAIELFDILSAVDRPEHTGLVKAAMVSSVYGATESFLLRLKDEDELMAGWQDRFRDYRRIWEEKGFVPMISRLIHDDDPELSPCADLDERGLTNIYHLVELLSQAALDQGADRSQSRSMLLRWFRNQLFKDTREQTADELRLESDDKAVAIVTIHKSKGLEYPIVFLPYLWAGTRSIDKSGPAVFHDPLNQDEL